jgi:predicted molibdopterin-dependent oxidoreductase YjgC
MWGLFGCLPRKNQCGIQSYRKEEGQPVEKSLRKKSKKMNLTIDGKKVEAEGRRTILDVARENDIYIPALCDHPILEPFGGCRLCIVEIQGRRGYAPSCSTYVEEGMEVRSDSPQLRQLRKDILGLILTEHPDACLVCAEKQNCDDFKSTIRKVGEVTGCVLCPNNGRCDLQDVVEAVQVEKVDFPSVYRDFEIKKNDPFFDRNYNLCILCGRCVRVCHELRGASTVHFINRGSEAVIGTVLGLPLQQSGCQFCGACVDVCPTGALTERAIKYEPLPDGTSKTICAFCSVGCSMDVKLNKGRILSVKPSEDCGVNKGQACVRGRFLTSDVVYSAKRILRPMIRRKRQMEEVPWDEALDFVAQKIKTFKPNEVGVVYSPQLSCEDHFVAEKFAREAFKAKNVAVAGEMGPLDTLSQLARKNGCGISFNFKKEDIARSDVLFVTGTELALSHPVLWLDVLNAVRHGAKLVIASAYEQVGNRYASLWLPVKPGAEDLLFLYLAKAILEKGKRKTQGLEGFPGFKRTLDKLDLSEAAEEIGVDEQRLLQTADLLVRDQSCFIAGTELTRFSRKNRNMAALWNLSLLCKAPLIPLGAVSNGRGIVELKRNDAQKMIASSQIIHDAEKGKIKALYFIGMAPPHKKLKTEFLVVQNSFMDETSAKADVILPATTFVESEGTVVNAEGRIQAFDKVIPPMGEAKPDWWILSELAKKIKKKGFEFKKSLDILKEIKKETPSFSKISPTSIIKGKTPFVDAGEKGNKKFLPLKSRDPIPKADKKFPLDLLADGSVDHYKNFVFSQEIRGFEMIRNSRWVKINPGDAKSMKLKDGDIVDLEIPGSRMKGVVKITETVPRGAVRTGLLSGRDFEDSSLPLRVKIKRGK